MSSASSDASSILELRVCSTKFKLVDWKWNWIPNGKLRVCLVGRKWPAVQNLDRQARSIDAKSTALSETDTWPAYAAINAKACALALAGKFEEAITIAETALQSESFANDSELDGGVLARLRLAEWKEKQLHFHSTLRE